MLEKSVFTLNVTLMINVHRHLRLREKKTVSEIAFVKYARMKLIYITHFL